TTTPTSSRRSSSTSLRPWAGADAPSRNGGTRRSRGLHPFLCKGPGSAPRGRWIFAYLVEGMDETQGQTDVLFGTLRNAAEPAVCAAIEALVRDGEDRHLVRINVLAFAAKRGLDEEAVISAFLHAARLGL